MHFVILTSGKNETLSIQHLHHAAAGSKSASEPNSRHVNLLVLDARGMSEACLAEATKKVEEVRRKHGLGHGVLLCTQPTLPLVVASIRVHLRDVITQYISARHLLQILRSAVPGLSRSDFNDIVLFLRTFNAFSTEEGDPATIARRSEELARLAETLAGQEKALALEKDRIARTEHDLRERSRRLDRQIARMQNDADITTTPSNPPLGASEYEAMSRRLDKRAAELDVREKLLNEMQALLLSTPEATKTKNYPTKQKNAPD